MNREALHDLANRIPEHDLAAAQQYLRYLATSPAYRAALSAPPDDEPVTADDSKAIEKATGEIQAGKVVSHDDILREFGLR
ncbi:MAG TPA: hypothetical protein VN924_23810 [Bryobacteraceae bacterium]|nr:hypothetical protein [Bryobacteraceae bacterium]